MANEWRWGCGHVRCALEQRAHTLKKAVSSGEKPLVRTAGERRRWKMRPGIIAIGGGSITDDGSP